MIPNTTDKTTDGMLPSPTCYASWIPGDKPGTPKGSSTLMWVTMRHKGSDKLSVGVLTYHNGHVMPCADQCDPPDCAVPHNPEEDGYCEEYEWTCWSDGYCEHCETEWVWSGHYTEIVAHAPVSKPEPFQMTCRVSLGDNSACRVNPAGNATRDGNPCPHCSSLKDPWFSRVVPMSYVCCDCGKDWDSLPENLPHNTHVEGPADTGAPTTQKHI